MDSEKVPFNSGSLNTIDLKCLLETWLLFGRRGLKSIGAIVPFHLVDL